MRVKYTFTTDIKDVPSGVHFHLSKFLGRRSINNNLQYLMNLIIKEELNFSLILKKIANLREQLHKFDFALDEASTILKACQQFELEALTPNKELTNVPTNKTEPARESPVPATPAEPPKADEPKHTSLKTQAEAMQKLHAAASRGTGAPDQGGDRRQLYANNIQRNLAQMTDIAQTLGNLKQSKAWQAYEENLPVEEEKNNSEPEKADE